MRTIRPIVRYGFDKDELRDQADDSEDALRAEMIDAGVIEDW